MSITIAGMLPAQMQVFQFPGPFSGPMIPPQVVEIVQSFFITVAVIALGIPVIRAFSHRFLERPPTAPALSGDVMHRLERIEQAVDSIAIEVERISEAQRFSTKLLAESTRPSTALSPSEPPA